jgi:hypothetical protein
MLLHRYAARNPARVCSKAPGDALQQVKGVKSRVEDPPGCGGSGTGGGTEELCEETHQELGTLACRVPGKRAASVCLVYRTAAPEACMSHARHN